MANTISYNMRSPAVKRLLQEARELQQDKCNDYTAQPLEDNLFEWHFVIRGPDGTEFEGGRYHGRILLPSEYPFKPPNLMLMTPNGRFELNKKICLSITGYHPEYWLPAWGIRTVLLGLLGFMTTKANGAIGGIDYTESERKILAQKSRNWKCLTFKNDSDMPQFSFVYEEQQKKSILANSSKSVNSSEIINSDIITSSDEQQQQQQQQNQQQHHHHHHNHHQQHYHHQHQYQHHNQQQNPTTSSPISIYFIDAGIVILVSIVIALLARKFS
ncbi:ubiquitin-conjugating enzyme E2 J1 [Rhizophagus clarus]|uniref:Ubiquitin-conjugating enzyme E2 J1 n=1 Tax=Rhizophagus clarus TaxID=94130 RepID=A0A8H3LX05_9GLOM|nr:ubiquitin-conjugating enzyme E2 J1 [Rhizophagus clarus]